MRAIVTVVGKDRVGIIANVCNLLAKYQVNVLDISQTVLQGYFTMIMMVDATHCELPIAELIKMMIGKTVFEQYTPRAEESKKPTLQVKHLSNHKLKDLSFDVHDGEIVGFYGLVGAGKTELARAIYGVDAYEGDILFNAWQCLIYNHA